MKLSFINSSSKSPRTNVTAKCAAAMIGASGVAAVSCCPPEARREIAAITSAHTECCLCKFHANDVLLTSWKVCDFVRVNIPHSLFMIHQNWLYITLKNAILMAPKNFISHILVAMKSVISHILMAIKTAFLIFPWLWIIPFLTFTAKIFYINYWSSYFISNYPIMWLLCRF